MELGMLDGGWGCFGFLLYFQKDNVFLLSRQDILNCQHTLIHCCCMLCFFLLSPASTRAKFARHLPVAEMTQPPDSLSFTGLLWLGMGWGE
jgi:hypothetical protein